MAGWMTVTAAVISYLTAGFLVSIIMGRYKQFDEHGTGDITDYYVICILLWPIVFVVGVFVMIGSLAKMIAEGEGGRGDGDKKGDR